MYVQVTQVRYDRRRCPVLIVAKAVTSIQVPDDCGAPDGCQAIVSAGGSAFDVTETPEQVATAVYRALSGNLMLWPTITAAAGIDVQVASVDSREPHHAP